ncbi:hypothetical protein E2C01_062672 [Portunus trituberculatus]|uniref:Uncharacterized protein n=1 Tax=Portunus trituberculatus TaxID=210409 RepID=A0A5B7H8I7_PORTR|nr:hypothetical protein [Portunus trituberculatus]
MRCPGLASPPPPRPVHPAPTSPSNPPPNPVTPYLSYPDSILFLLSSVPSSYLRHRYHTFYPFRALLSFLHRTCYLLSILQDILSSLRTTIFIPIP